LRGEHHLPSHLGDGGFDHGDVHQPSGQVFIAHKANGTVEVIDGARLEHLATIGDCPEASGVLAPQDSGFVIAAARGAGYVLVIDPTTHAVLRKVSVGGRPNGLAWDSRRRRVLVAPERWRFTCGWRPASQTTKSTPSTSCANGLRRD
jgi:YVTN family beta-propeller protein